MKIRFLKDFRPQGQATTIPSYAAGSVYGFDGPVAEGYARKYIGRGLAVEVDPVPQATAAEIEAAEAAAAAQAEADRLKEEEEAIAARNAVVIPEDWEDLSWPDLRSLASSFSDDPIKNKNEALDAIAAELERRSA